MTALEFTQPRPGSWRRLADHFPGALTPEYQAIYAETCPVGMERYMREYGVLATTLDVAFVHGHLYIAPLPVLGPPELRKAPPTAAIWLTSRLHPAFRKRTRAARRTLRDRPWRDVAQRWFTTEWAEWQARDLEHQRIAVDELCDSDLVAHLRASRALVAAGYTRHFELHGDDLLPVGRLIARCESWGIDPAVATGALDGLSFPFEVTNPPDWLLITGYDLDSLAWVELDRPPATDGAGGRVVAPADLRALVPEAHHAELEVLVADAQLAVPLRIHNGRLTGAWPMGLLRRAMLAAGRRLAFDDPRLAVEVTVDELCGALDRTADAVELEREAGRRRDDRAERSRWPAPAVLGPAFPIPPLSALPAALAEIGAAQLASADHMFGTAGAIGIGGESHTGRALVVDDPSAALDMIEVGDVIVTRATSPAWNAVLGQAGALVTTTGGVVSHAGLMARELGIPAVIGDETAFDRLSTGDVVTVDPVRAVVDLSA